MSLRHDLVSASIRGSGADSGAAVRPGEAMITNAKALLLLCPDRGQMVDARAEGQARCPRLPRVDRRVAYGGDRKLVAKF